MKKDSQSWAVASKVSPRRGTRHCKYFLGTVLAALADAIKGMFKIL